MDAAELSRCGEEALSPHDYGIPQDIPESAYSVEFARAHEADAQMEQQAAHEEEEREEQREEEEREEEEREQQEHEHQ
jgi:ribosomal protein L12E/L44/L45/RPP1/RPP2